MTSKKQKTFDIEQHELVENAQNRIKQKKRLYYHFVVFLVGGVFLIIANKFLNVWPEVDWFVWAIIFWAFLLIIHVINVFVTNRFLGKEWERKQREKLIAKQQAKIAKIENEILNESNSDDVKKNLEP